jgi:hypothetical protein
VRDLYEIRPKTFGRDCLRKPRPVVRRGVSAQSAWGSSFRSTQTDASGDAGPGRHHDLETFALPGRPDRAHGTPLGLAPAAFLRIGDDTGTKPGV